MPQEFALDFELTHSKSQDVIRWIKKLIANLDKDLRQECRNKLSKICRWEVRAMYKRRGESFTACVIEACIALKDAQLLLVVFRDCSSYRPGFKIQHAVAEALHVFPFRDVKPR